MKDLYKEIGVGRKASKDAIRKAYRRKSKVKHPDAGGKSEDFALLRLAHDVLTDDERRERYDATGEFGGKPLDNGFADAVNVIAGALEEVIQKIEQKGADPVSYNIVSDMRTLVGARLDDVQRARSAGKEKIRKVERLLGRFRTKGDNFFEGILKQKIGVIQQSVAQLDRQEIPMKRALEMLKESSFQYDANISTSAYSLQDYLTMAMR